MIRRRKVLAPVDFTTAGLSAPGIGLLPAEARAPLAQSVPAMSWFERRGLPASPGHWQERISEGPVA